MPKTAFLDRADVTWHRDERTAFTPCTSAYEHHAFVWYAIEEHGPDAPYFARTLCGTRLKEGTVFSTVPRLPTCNGCKRSRFRKHSGVPGS